MKRMIMTLAAVLVAFAANAQQSLWGNGEIVSPEIHPDRTVTFRFQAPKAIRVQVTGDFLPTQKIEIPGHGSYDAKGYKYEYFESEGGHIWRNWRIYLTRFAQKIFK